MNLLEVEGKRLFFDYGIPIPMGRLSHGDAPSDFVRYPAVVKAQVPTGGRGKAGGIRVVTDVAELGKAVQEIIGTSIKGHKVWEVLIEEKIESRKELYISITVDRAKRMPIIMASAMGGMDVESVPEEKLFKDWIDPWVGVQPFLAKDMAYALEMEPEIAGQFLAVLQGMWRLFQDIDAELIEINPLAVTSDNRLIAIDSKVVIDDDALFRHEGFKKLSGDITPLEKKARDRGIAFVQLDGDIGVIANGAGLTMATLDFLAMHGGRGGVFLDLGGTDDPEKVKEALLLMAEAKPKVVLINIFGGITKCDTVASGLLQAFKDGGLDLPIVARIKGVNEQEAVEMLKGTRIQPVLSLDDAAKAAVKIAGGGG
jgi:succinyl-CoA synthetase beta subunit